MGDLSHYCAVEREKVIQKLALTSKRAGGVPDLDTNKELYQRLDKLLTRLETEVTVTPTFKYTTKIDVGLTLIYNNNEFHFPEEYRERAKALFEKWEESRWGAPAPPPPPTGGDQSTSEPVMQEDDGGQGNDLPTVARKKTARRTDSGPGTIKFPPEDHPIWGVDGIMHGIALKRRDATESQVLDSRYDKRDCKVFGDNGLEVGQWFARRLVALFRGAHGSSQAGIVGDGNSGAYSIVVSGAYEDLDQDRGDVIYYSGSNSHSNTDPRQPPPATTGTQALYRSIETGEAVRVLRTSSGAGRLRPVCGLRYDGLYRVVRLRNPMNGKGGRYDQFELVRVEGQVPLDRLKLRPTLQEQRQFEKIADGFRR
ncbi:E3 ubiquitin-protein ligase ORTHRUS 1 [Acrodontium crateriforme]|uniref:E3 ubiquitin-protein ligase ORTHRUS 1 n=1 Tax=Acrodontium crateriforme TaxID=150365 RepID=A0AAQ3RCC2_9PEZI|nr:E3 ubiquitin-protein ligase ORTHRUS 1 [Acrodontium crateriforme]